MNKKEFQAFFEAKEFIVKGTNTTAPVAFGIIGDYPVIATLYGKNLINLLVSVDMMSAKNCFKELRKENKQFAFMLNEQGLKATMQVKDKTREEDWTRLSAELITVLKQKGVYPDTTCGICGRKDCDAIMFWDSHYSPVHTSCVHTIENQAKDQVEKNDAEGNYIAGVVGAILGAFVGVIPSILTIIFMNTIWSVLFALIPICTCFGYKLFKGKANIFMIVITIILSVLSVFLIEIEIIVFMFMSEYAMPFKDAVALTMEALGDGEVISSVMSDIVQYLIFVGLGIWIAWGQITKTATSLVKGVGTAKTTLRPYGDGTVQNAMEQPSLSPFGVMQDEESR